VNISQSRTEQILDERVAAQPLVEVRWGKRVLALRQGSDGVELTCDDGTRVGASFVVLAAGARCDELRALLGVTFDGHSFDDRFLICDIRTDLSERASERRFHFDPEWNPGRQVLVHPCPDSTFRIDWQVPAEFGLDAEVRSGALDRRIRAVIGDRPYEVVWQSVYRFHSRCVDRMRVGRVLLAGDAAHLVAPFGARGLNSGVPDAENAAWKIAFVLRGWAPEQLLESYHQERHAAARENLAVTTATMDFLVPRTLEQVAYRRDVLSRSAADPTARALVDSGRLAEPFWYADSPLTTPSSARPFAGRPARGTAPAPGPGILVPDGAWDGSHRFRMLARDGFLLLVTPGADVPAAREAAQSVPAPVRVLELAEGDPTGALTEALDARPGEVWVVRPDAHVAAVLERPSSATIVGALHRALAIVMDREESEHGVLPTVR
jgi:pentachlorophenol monooxygenase/3-(3-hydroxy-phenyl)propionate hydroxylase